MTLAEVAATVRKQFTQPDGIVDEAIESALRRLEADPEWTLSGRLRAYIETHEQSARSAGSWLGRQISDSIARELRRVLEPPKQGGPT